ncbi:MAG: enolase C-terminal domain-like protein [Planctomycetota bacterium]
MRESLRRRGVLKAGLVGGAAGVAATFVGSALGQERTPTADGAAGLDEAFARLNAAAGRAVLDRSWWPEPVLIERVQLLRRGEDEFLCRVVTRDGAQGWSVGNGFQLRHLYPVFPNKLAGFFAGKDARDWERLLEEVYAYRGNYKLQGLALWVPLATLEFAVLDLLGRLAGRSIGALLGPVVHPKIAVYQANSHRGLSAEATLTKIRETVEATGARALKFKVGRRLGRDTDDPPGRSERLVPMVREAFGDAMTIYADANGGYTVDGAIRLGRIMEAHGYGFFEEPVPFDHYGDTRRVAEALSVPIAGGEQEPSLRNFRGLIARGGLDVVQPDPFYFGGMVRSLRVARMAEAMGLPCVPHISGSGLGYLYMMHFVSALPNAGPFHEFKGFAGGPPITCDTSDLQVHGGEIKVPTGPGLGVELDPGYVAEFRPVGRFQRRDRGAVGQIEGVPDGTPKLLTTFDGEAVTTAEAWEGKRRPEVLAALADHVYGRTPALGATWAVTSRRDEAFETGGRTGTMRQMEVELRPGPAVIEGKPLRVSLLVFLPPGAKDGGAGEGMPTFLALNSRGNQEVHPDPRITPSRHARSGRGERAHRWPIGDLWRRGYALATFQSHDVFPDRPDGEADSVVAWETDDEPEAGARWKALGAWAWGMSRALDVLEQAPGIDGRRVIALGHSRRGKASLWAAAQDTRFAAVVSNNSGCGGAALSRRRVGETVAAINAGFPHWFCDNFRRYNDREDTLPIDQHHLLAMSAPRPVYVASAEQDAWADPVGEYLATHLASAVYPLYGQLSLCRTAPPPVDTPLSDTPAGYHVRRGGHDLLAYDWACFMDFCDRRGLGASERI